MKLRTKFIISSFTLAIVALLSCLLTGCSCNIIYMIFSKDSSPLGIITLMLFIPVYLYSVCFLMIVNFTEYSNKIFSDVYKLLKKSIIAFCIIKLVSDLAFYFLSKLSVSIYFTYWLPYILNFLLIVTYILKKLKIEKRKITKLTVFCIVFGVLCSVGYIIYYIEKLIPIVTAIKEHKEKYMPYPKDMTTVNYIISRQSIIAVIVLSAFIWFILLAIFKTPSIKSKEKGFIIYYVRLIIAGCAYLFYFLLAILISPYGSLIEISVPKCDSLHHFKETYIGLNYKGIEIYRKRTCLGEKYLSAHSYRINIKCGNETIIEYYPLFPIKLYDEMEEVGSTDIYHWDDYILAYYDNDTLKAILLSDIKNLPFNADISIALKELINSGDFEFFENSCDYFIKYDKSYIISVIKDYAADGIMDYASYSDYIYKEYKQNFAINKLKGLNINPDD